MKISWHHTSAWRIAQWWNPGRWAGRRASRRLRQRRAHAQDTRALSVRQTTPHLSRPPWSGRRSASPKCPAREQLEWILLQWEVHHWQRMVSFKPRPKQLLPTLARIWQSQTFCRRRYFVWACSKTPKATEARKQLTTHTAPNPTWEEAVPSALEARMSWNWILHFEFVISVDLFPSSHFSLTFPLPTFPVTINSWPGFTLKVTSDNAGRGDVYKKNDTHHNTCMYIRVWRVRDVRVY